jgi:putative FmdB family regulatory protein
MPTYEYLCEACDHRFELFQSITADPVRVCPNCGRRKVRRLIGPGAAILFKGSGFYQTDYRSESYKKAAAAEKSASSSGGNGDTSGSGKKEKEKKKAKSEV